MLLNFLEIGPCFKAHLLNKTKHLELLTKSTFDLSWASYDIGFIFQ